MILYSVEPRNKNTLDMKRRIFTSSQAASNFKNSWPRKIRKLIRISKMTLNKK